MKRIILITALLFCWLIAGFHSSALGGENPDTPRSYYLFSPMEGAVIKDQKPNISFSFGTVLSGLSSVILLVNGKNVTDASVVTNSFISYMPQEALPVGKNTVNVQFFTADGKKTDFSWSFFVDEEKLINSVIHDGISPMMSGEELTVEIKGKAGCTGVFNIGAFKKGIPMKEKSPGVYRGSYRVGNFDYATDEIVTGILKDKSGSVFKAPAADKISIFAQLFVLKILSPKNRDFVGKSFLIKGRTKPKSMIFITTRLGYKNTDFITATGPDTGGLTATSDENGFFEKPLGFPLFMKGMECSISIYARDSNKSKSNTEELTVYFRDEGTKPQ